MGANSFLSMQSMTRKDFKHQKQFKIRNAKLTQVRSTLWPMKEENTRRMSTVYGPNSNIILSNGKRIQSTPSVTQGIRRTRKSSMINNQTKGWSTSLDDTNFVPYHGIRCSATKTIMINLDTRNSNHELMKIENDGVPKSTNP